MTLSGRCEKLDLGKFKYQASSIFWLDVVGLNAKGLKDQVVSKPTSYRYSGVRKGVQP